MELYGLLLTTGILGSLHCIGMCGPLALSLPLPREASRIKIATGRILYQSGRIFSYMTIGLIFGSIGGVIVIAGWQQLLSIIAGSILIIMALVRLTGLKNKIGINRITEFVTRQLSIAFSGQKRSSMFLTGMLNGYLPCGLVYMAAAMTVATGDVFDAAIGMAFFGLGTFPVMFVMSMGTTFLKKRWRFRLNRYSMIFALAIGILFVLRGMNLGVKYISPQVNQDSSIECCDNE